jgi:hypothetical protein
MDTKIDYEWIIEYTNNWRSVSVCVEKEAGIAAKLTRDCAIDYLHGVFMNAIKDKKTRYD